MATNKTVPNSAEEIVSSIRLKLLDPLGQSIAGLKYQIRQGQRIVAKGITDGQGRVQEFASHIGKELSIQVEHFTTGAMTQIHALTPWNERHSLKLVSGKIKQQTTLTKDQGPTGAYRRRTHTVKGGDTLSAIAKSNHTTAQAIAGLNGIAIESILRIGQILKIPTQTASPRKHLHHPLSRKLQRTQKITDLKLLRTVRLDPSMTLHPPPRHLRLLRLQKISHPTSSPLMIVERTGHRRRP